MCYLMTGKCSGDIAKCVSVRNRQALVWVGNVCAGKCVQCQIQLIFGKDRT